MTSRHIWEITHNQQHHITEIRRLETRQEAFLSKLYSPRIHNLSFYLKLFENKIPVEIEIERRNDVDATQGSGQEGRGQVDLRHGGNSVQNFIQLGHHFVLA